MELVWHGRRGEWHATLDGFEVARFGRPPTDEPARVTIGEEIWLFTKESGCHSHASWLEPAPLTSRKVSWRTPTREVVTPTGGWVVRFHWFSDGLELRRDDGASGAIRSLSWWRKQPVLMEVGIDVSLVEAVWLSWNGLHMREERDSWATGGG